MQQDLQRVRVRGEDNQLRNTTIQGLGCCIRNGTQHEVNAGTPSSKDTTGLHSPTCTTGLPGKARKASAEKLYHKPRRLKQRKGGSGRGWRAAQLTQARTLVRALAQLLIVGGLLHQIQDSNCQRCVRERVRFRVDHCFIILDSARKKQRKKMGGKKVRGAAQPRKGQMGGCRGAANAQHGTKYKGNSGIERATTPSTCYARRTAMLTKNPVCLGPKVGRMQARQKNREFTA
jgi:hypothetical protein